MFYIVSLQSRALQGAKLPVYVCMEKKIASSSLIAFMSYFARTKLVLLE